MYVFLLIVKEINFKVNWLIVIVMNAYCLFAAAGDNHTTTAKRLWCGCARHFVPHKFHMNF